MKPIFQAKVLIALIFLVIRPGYATEPTTYMSTANLMTRAVLDISNPVSLTAIDDAYVKGGANSSTNYGSASILEIKQGSIANYYRKSYVKFDLSSLTTADSAVVRLYTNSSGSVPIVVYKTSNSWDESTVTWDNAPALGTAIATTVIGSTNQYYDWDVSAYIQDNLGSTISFAFYDASASNTTVEFSSKEGANAPKLIVYCSPPVDPTSLTATVASSSAIDLSWSDNADNETGYKVERKAGAGAFAEIASLGANSTSYSDAGLSSLTYYTYRVSAYNVGGSSYSNEANETTLGTPITYTYDVSEDAFVKGGTNADTNYGSDSNLEVKQGSTANFFRKSFLKFDLSNQGLTTVSQATVRVYANSVSATTITAFELSDAWSEHTVTWNSAPSDGSSITSEALSTENVYYEFDVTAYVQSQISGDGVVSVSLWDASATNKIVNFNSNDAATNRPELVIETFTTTADPSGITGYFVDGINGNDANDGLTEATAWKTFTNVNATTFAANDTILLKAGNTWFEPFYPKGSGTSGNPIVLTSYGVGPLPIIDAQGAILSGFSSSASLILYNQEYWEITNVHVKNYAAHEGESPLLKNAIAITGNNAGTLHDINISNIEVSEVNGKLDTRTNGGIAYLIRGTDGTPVPTNFDGVKIENCYIHDVSNCGVFTDSRWDTRDQFTSFGQTTLDGSTNDWYPSYNIEVRNNRFERTGGNGMVLRVADGPLVEYNTFYMCGLYTTGNASYPFNCDNALWQYNEASHTVYNEGDADASGFDSDYYCKNTIIQYNYSHDNDYGSLLITSRGESARNFNVGTIVRYNVFENDGHHMIRVSGTPTNSHVYNNVFYVGEDLDGMEVLWHKNWGGYSDSTFYSNNIFYIEGSNSVYDFELSTNNFFDHNIFYGNHDSTEPTDANKITANPLFVNPGTGGFGFGTLDGYQLQSGSPAINAGANITGNGGFDFWGNTLSDSYTDIGAFEYDNPSARLFKVAVDEVVAHANQLNIYPNPLSHGVLTIDLKGYTDVNQVEIMISDLTGQMMYKTTIQNQSTIELDMHHLQRNSTYIVHVTSGQTVNYSKLLVR
ncbi:DNRLRE domain-containing protein [Reichenbachiella agarivorans]|uniref:DNRLRE domain-containing protein n=1 Tax=Reichenbachiella agarivorans TaxID=2979464 RepID=A0ABY6CTN1_9BACT|nr:DNRLRE domain-containing protein [Reichenbachiella agarivorans]UXP33882.1 DNRLRE domain-containing protein [Reichenbachiella agarivorans]